MATLDTDLAGQGVLARRVDRIRWTVCLAVAGLVAVVVMVPVLGLSWEVRAFSVFLFLKQDIIVVTLLVVIMLLRPALHCPQAVWRLSETRQHLFLAGVSLALLLLCWGGHYVVLDGYDLSRDEQMAVFDASILRQGRLYWPIGPEWRPIAAALNQAFILPIGDHEGWVSAYLPVNAAFRALVSVAADPALTSPIFVGIGALALWRIAARLWPDDVEARLVALVLYASSSQVFVTGMTAYAMSGHLGLNLLWLSLYMRGGRVGHGCALLVGWLAVGLHQPVFHPVFALPFIVVLARLRQWRPFCAYVAGYAVIGAFWFAWPIWISSHGIAPVAADDPSGTNYIARMMLTLRKVDANPAWVMSLNLLRFISWQHVLLLPLVAAGLGVAWRGDATARALAAGPVLMVAMMFVLLPYQGHGWGYRYLHGFVGNLCLLGGFGWRALAPLSIRRVFTYGSAVTVLVLMPVHLWMTHAQVAPYAAVDRMIRRSGAAVTIIDTNAAPFATDLVINRPDLEVGPVRLRASALAPEGMASLCEGRSVLFVGADELQPINAYFWQDVGASPDLLLLERAARASGCFLVTLKGLPIPGPLQ